VEVVCREGPRYVLELAKFGAEFTRCGEGHGAACAPEDGVGPGGLHLTREGGHSARRIVHAAGEESLAALREPGSWQLTGSQSTAAVICTCLMRSHASTCRHAPNRHPFVTLAFTPAPALPACPTCLQTPPALRLSAPW
jgi:hypothetical protein